MRLSERPGGTRTHDLSLSRRLLYPLSYEYSPILQQYGANALNFAGRRTSSTRGRVALVRNPIVSLLPQWDVRVYHLIGGVGDASVLQHPNQRFVSRQGMLARTYD